MGTVFKARHRRMKRIVALKVLSRELCEDAAFVMRFQREVEALAKLGHPNIVMAYDADEAPIGHFLVMEYVDGRDLSSLVEKNGPLPIASAIDCAIQAGRGLAYAHSKGMVHRDIKPANLLRAQDGTVKITDLGLVTQRGGKAAGAAASSVTQAGGILGTVNYMPPEQASDPAAADHRADIYALGCTLHYLLVGTPPYPGDSIMAVLIKHQAGTIPTLSARRPGIPAGLDDIFQKMLAKELEERYQSMAEVVSALEALAPAPAGPSPNTTHVPASSGIPTSSGQALEGTQATPAPRPDALSVLIVEPSRVQAGIIRKYLEAGGVTVTGAARAGGEALGLAKSRRPDAIISALYLDDMTGTELAQQARAEVQPPPAFILVSSEDEAQGASISKLGQAVMLHKPFTPEQLMHSLNVVAGRPARPATPGVDRGKVRVLIVDDSPAARAHERAVLSGLGFADFTEAADGAHAIAAVTSSPFGLIVTDYNMPLMDGHALISYLRQTPASAGAPILMVTSETGEALLGAVRALGVTDIFEKAFPADKVGAALDKLFGAG
jgi:CheY-like chemotaxis protein/tRNA A-37 threonylcarbamoyl transferase component Bud32